MGGMYLVCTAHVPRLPPWPIHSASCKGYLLTGHAQGPMIPATAPDTVLNRNIRRMCSACLGIGAHIDSWFAVH